MRLADIIQNVSAFFVQNKSKVVKNMNKEAMQQLIADSLSKRLVEDFHISNP